MISDQIWDMKYRLKDSDGTPLEQTVQDTWQRIASSLAEVEEDPKYWTDQFYHALEDYKFLPAGRITAGAGTGRDVTHFSCFVLGTIPDSMSGIFEHLREAALTLQQGGGIGYDFSTIRPKGAPVKGVAADASGPLSFMDVWDSMCRTIMSAGSRRGAMMATMRCDHPDIIDFIEAKQDPVRLRMFNMSVLVTDAFMEAVEAGADWYLRFDGIAYKVMKARDLWDQIMKATYAYAEPGVIFIDRINQQNNLKYCETISATNPCVVEGTLVSTPNGLVPVENVQVGDIICTINGQHPVKEIEVHENEELYKVELSDGSSLEVTPAHIFHVADGKKFDTDTRLDQLSIGAKIRLAPSIPPNVKTVCDQPGFSERNTGFLVGLTIGDGCFTPSSRSLKIACSNKEPEWSSLVQGVIRQLGFVGVNKSTDEVDCVESSAAMHFLDKIGLPRGYSKNKELPLHLFNSNPEFLKGYIDGMISSDGNIHMSKSNPMVRVTSNNKQSLMMLKKALNCWGILARVYEESSKKVGSTGVIKGRTIARNQQGYVLCILGSGIKVLYDEIGISRPVRRDRLKKLVNRYSLTGCTWTAEVKAITATPSGRVYDLFEPETDTWITEGIVNRGCGEQPLPPYGACLLGSVNLARLVTDPFTAEARVDIDALYDLVSVAIRMMDNVIDVSKFSLPEQAAEAKAKRRLGLGVTGLADALLMTGLRYGSDEAVEQTEEWLKVINTAAYNASIGLATEKGAFPLFDPEQYTASTVEPGVMKTVKQFGIRNSHLTSIAPTGTISLYAGNVSSGIEPVFAYAYKRKVRQPDGSHTEEEVVDYAVQMWRDMFGDKPLPDHFIDAQTLTPAEHIRMQAAAQKHIDSSISKTINCPEDIAFEDFQDIYMDAWESGCKGCTTYRPNDITGSILTVEKPKKAHVPILTERPETMQGKTYKLKWPELDRAFYITINDHAGAPLEIFVNTQNVEAQAWITALTRMISAVFRRGGDLSFLAEELKAIHDPRGGAFLKGRYVPSLQAAIGGIIEEHLGIEPPKLTQGVQREGCSDYGNCNVIREDGCSKCLTCGWSKCG